MKTKLFVSSSPHVFAKQSTQTIMRDVIIALMPACVVGVYFFGIKAAMLILLSTFSAVAFEWIILKFLKRPGSIKDLSAAVTGLLIGLNISASTPWWMAVIGSAFAIVIVKHPFGGLGHNFMNPALAARVFLVACWPVAMTNMFVVPGGSDAIASATQMALIKGGAPITNEILLNLATGNVAGCIGETSAIALLIGGVYLFARRIIRWRIPVTYIGTVFVLSYVFNDYNLINSFAQVLGGGLMLGAIFMATDYSTSPVTPRGQLLMGIGCGLMTVIIRFFSKSAEGVSYSILFLNICVPLIDRFTRPKIFGEVKNNA